MDPIVAAAAARIPELQNWVGDTADCQRLGGLTNLVYRIGVDDEDYVLRIPGDGTEAYIDRGVEAHNARVAAAAGVSAEVLFFDEADGLMLARYLDGCTTMTPDTFCTTPGAPMRAAVALKRMHEFTRPFQFRFELFSMIDDYLATLSKLGAKLPDGYYDVVKEADIVRLAVDDNAGSIAPCHCDPLCENFLDNGERMWIVDWEYSGMNDPMWDLGDLSVEAGFDPEHDEAMLRAYCGGRPPDAVRGRMTVYKAMCDLLWTLWGLIQHANDNPADDFWAYASNRFERCKALMNNPEFGVAVDAIKGCRP